MHVQLSLELVGISPETLTYIALLALTWWSNTRRRP